jgi:hypothetical protein
MVTLAGFLVNRQSQVRVSGTLSLPLQITSGVTQGSLLGHFLFNVFINDLCNSIKHCKFVIFADDFKIVCVFISPHDCLLRKSDINSVSDWSAANSMRLYIAKTFLMSYFSRTNVLRYEYQLWHAATTHTSCITDLGVFFYSKLYFHNDVDFLFSECIKLLGLIRSITFRFSFLNCLYVL